MALRVPLILRLSLPALIAVACTTVVGETPVETTGTKVAQPGSTTTVVARDCVRVTGGSEPVDTGALATDALFLSGEQFLCADNVVVVGESDLNEVIAAAQLAASLNGPLLFPHPQLAAELGRLKPMNVHIVGSVDVNTPPGIELISHDASDAVELTKRALGATDETELPLVPDAGAIVETVNAIRTGERVVRPETASSTSTPPQPVIEPDELIDGLAVPSESQAVWMVSAASPRHALLAASAGTTVGASVVAIDANDLLAHPIVGQALVGHSAESIRFIGTAPQIDPWHLAVLINGLEVPGGGFSILPREGTRRFVAFYGHPETTALGVLGEQGPEETIARMEPFLTAYTGDGAQTVPVFEMIASVAAAQATSDNDYSFEWPISTFDEWVAVAKDNDAYIILDLQAGRDDFLSQAKQYEEMLRLPFVGLALDPEWRLQPDQVHLKQVGRVHADEVNQVIHWLADLVRDNGLPQKMLIVHQFRTFMIQDRHLLEQRPELQLVIQMDGDGTEAQKDDTYAALNVGAEDAFWAWGWKNFFDEDEPGPPTPESTMGKEPSPIYVSYQ